ncbi:MAG: hypothetical protein RLZZ67_201 [Candidatus Parcubacteria bacterium]|jgi:hypothetical protein
MAQNPMQDIVPKGGKSIRRVAVSETRPRAVSRPVARTEEVRVEIKKPTKVEQIEHVHKQDVEEIRITHDETDTIETVRREFESSRTRPNFKKKLKKNWKKIALIGGSVAVVLLVVILSNIFHGATLTLTPRTKTQNIQSDYVAKKNAGSGELPFEIVSFKQTGSETIKATGEKQVDKRATGVVVIYNNYNTSVQRLIKNTRFATPEGLIFRITDSVTVPGKKGAVPGSVEATIVADEVGDSYNVGLKDFTIPGFKGDPRYTAFYARSKTALAGGFSGIQKVVAEADRVKAKAAIVAKVTADLIKQAYAEIDKNSAYFSNGYSVDFKSLAEASPSASEVTLREEGTLTLVVFNKQLLAGAIAREEISKFDGQPVVITNLDKITFKPKSDFKPATADSITFNLSGPASFEWYYDETTLKQALLGKSRSEIPAVLQKYPTVEKADISLRPFWSRSFPDSPDKILIKKAL